jgi:hypothetical protein
MVQYGCTLVQSGASLDVEMGRGWVTLEGSLSFACSKRANVHSNGKCMSDGADRTA